MFTFHDSILLLISSTDTIKSLISFLNALGVDMEFIKLAGISRFNDLNVFSVNSLRNFNPFFFSAGLLIFKLIVRIFLDLLIDVTNIYVTNAIHVIFHNSNCAISI